MSYRSERDLNIVSFLKPKDCNDYQEKYFLRAPGKARGVLFPYVYLTPINPAPEGSQIICLRSFPLAAFRRVVLHPVMGRVDRREVVRMGPLQGSPIHVILYVATPVQLVDEIECEMLYERAQIFHAAIFGREDTVRRVIQLSGRKMLPKDLIDRLIVNDVPTVFANLILKRSAAGFNYVDVFVLRALCNGAISQNELRAALDAQRQEPCLACGVSAGKAFNATFKLADEFYEGTFIVGSPKVHITPECWSEVRSMDGVPLDIGHAVTIRSSELADKVTSDRIIAWAHRIFRMCMFGGDPANDVDCPIFSPVEKKKPRSLLPSRRILILSPVERNLESPDSQRKNSEKDQCAGL